MIENQPDACPFSECSECFKNNTCDSQQCPLDSPLQCPSGDCVFSVSQCPSPKECTDENRRELCFDGTSWECMTLRQCLNTTSKGLLHISMTQENRPQIKRHLTIFHSFLLLSCRNDTNTTACPSGVRCWSGECQPSVDKVRSILSHIKSISFLTFSPIPHMNLPFPSLSK